MERIHDQDKNAWKKKETELNTQISELQKRMDMLEKEAKRRTNALRSEILLKSKKDSPSGEEGNVQTF